MLELHGHGAPSVTSQQALFLRTSLCVWSEIRWNRCVQSVSILSDKVTLRADGPRGKRRLCSTAWGLGPSRGAVPTLQVGLGLRGGSPWSCDTSPPEFLWQLLEAGLAALFCVSPSPLCFSEQIARGLVDFMFLCGNSSHTSGFSSVFVPSLEPCPCPWSCTMSSHPYCLNLSSEKK